MTTRIVVGNVAPELRLAGPLSKEHMDIVQGAAGAILATMSRTQGDPELKFETLAIAISEILVLEAVAIRQQTLGDAVVFAPTITANKE